MRLGGTVQRTLLLPIVGSNMMQISVVTVRHGETSWNIERRLQGSSNVGLNDVGRQQALAVAQRLKTEPFTHVFSSDLARAFDTARSIVSANTNFNLENIRSEPLLRERSFGVMEGKLWTEYQEVARQAGHTERMWEFTPEKAETEADVIFRGKKFLDNLVSVVLGANSFPAHVLVSSHGGFLKLLNVHLAAEKQCQWPSDGPSYKVIAPNTGISRFSITVDPDTKRIVKVVCNELYNADHLSQ